MHSARGPGPVPVPRRVRGRRCRICVLLTLCLVAVLSGATPLACIARYATNSGPGLRRRLGLTACTPAATTLGRLLTRLNGDALDDAVGAWLARLATDPFEDSAPVPTGLAVDGQTVRGSRTNGAAVHLLAAALHDSQTVTAGQPGHRALDLPRAAGQSFAGLDAFARDPYSDAYAT